jgi:hypothetical protein
MELTQPLTEMTTRNRKIMFLGSKTRPERKADNLPPSVSRLSGQSGIPRPPRPVTEITFFTAYTTRRHNLHVCL